jgi:hypothetical protein
MKYEPYHIDGACVWGCVAVLVYSSCAIGGLIMWLILRKGG